MQSISGINEAGINKLIQDIDDYANKIRKNYDLLEKILSSTASSLKGDTVIEFEKYLNCIKQNFKTINENILSYNRDLRKVKQGYNKMSDRIVTDLNRYNKIKEGG